MAQWYSRIGRPLSYLGLPGPHILDLIDWSSYLDYCTGVERLRKSGVQREEDLETHRKLHTHVWLHGMSSRFELRRGDIEDLVLNGSDVDGQRPTKHRVIQQSLYFCYDLVNLDFLGGIGQRNQVGVSRRVRAIKMLLERQQTTSFLLLLTLNVRDRLDDELTKYLIGAQRDATTPHVRETLDWYAACGEGMKDYKLKAMVPLFMRREAEVHQFECISYPPVAYEGNGDARMVHFVFELLHTPTNFHVFGAQTDEQVINQPLLRVADEKFHIADQQHPGFEFARYKEYLDFLPINLLDSLIIPFTDVSHGVVL